MKSIIRRFFALFLTIALLGTLLSPAYAENAPSAEPEPGRVTLTFADGTQRTSSADDVDVSYAAKGGHQLLFNLAPDELEWASSLVFQQAFVRFGDSEWDHPGELYYNAEEQALKFIPISSDSQAYSHYNPEAEAFFLPAETSVPHFTDVAESDWFFRYVNLCADRGLLNGTEENIFSPEASLSLAEVIVLSARLHSLRNGGGGVIPAYPSDLNNLVRFYAADGTQVGNLSDAEAWNGNLFIEFSPEFLNRTNPEEPLTMVLDAADLNWCGFDIESDAPLSFSGTYAHSDAAGGGEPLEGYSFNAGEDFHGDLYGFLVSLDFCILDPAAELGDVWFRDGLLYFITHQESDLSLSCRTFPEDMDFSDLGAMPARREEFALALASACGELNAINSISAVPDVPSSRYTAEQSDAILDFYRAGILTGVDSCGTFHGAGALTRAEAAAMLARVAEPALRVAFTL